jgi:hypothetical protein
LIVEILAVYLFALRTTTFVRWRVAEKLCAADYTIYFYGFASTYGSVIHFALVGTEANLLAVRLSALRNLELLAAVFAYAGDWLGAILVRTSQRTEMPNSAPTVASKWNKYSSAIPTRSWLHMPSLSHSLFATKFMVSNLMLRMCRQRLD